MRILETTKQALEYVRAERRSGATIGVVPTMGALHEGHLSLVQASVEQCDRTVATIFVNPTQFGPGEDFDKYPRTLDADLQLLSPLRTDAVFVPGVDEIYPPGCTTSVSPPEVAQRLEGEWRPEHFEGVATIVLKLFQTLPADFAFFGQKDFQQVRVIQAMVRDLNVPTEVVPCPIVREADGLAMSSRNRYLSQADRLRARRLSGALELVAQEIEKGQRDCGKIESLMRDHLMPADDKTGVDSIDYACLVDSKTLLPIEDLLGEVAALITARVGGTRLLDNRVFSV